MVVISLPNQAHFMCKSSIISKDDQNVILTELYRTTELHRLRVRIRSNSYKFQCFAIVEKWDGDKWQEVWHIEPSSMETREGLCYRQHSTKDFTADVYTLLTHVSMVLRMGDEANV